MVRKSDTNRKGNSWTEHEKKDVWNKGRVIPNFSSNTWRLDKCGKVMKWSEHGNRDSDNGWEIDHINPVSNGGNDLIDNLQPLHWENNADKSDKLRWTCPR
jgi:5-methylcytosine-specific restriction endonuclease McrA